MKKSRKELKNIMADHAQKQGQASVYNTDLADFCTSEEAEQQLRKSLNALNLPFNINGLPQEMTGAFSTFMYNDSLTKYKTEIIRPNIRR